jgi:tetratricopeptide (TPR) repeat protein
LGKPNAIQNSKKAGLIACLFLLLVPAKAIDKIWRFDANLAIAYELVLNLQTDQALVRLQKIEQSANMFQWMYVRSFCETVDVLISEDEKKFSEIDNRFKQRFRQLEKLEDSPEKLFLLAELNLQRGFNLFNLGQEMSAVFAMRSAYNYAQQCLNNYPDFIPIKKTNGIIQVMVGSVPDKYHWFMTLLGMKGSVSVGQQQLEELSQSQSSLSKEATLLYYTIKGLINQQVEEAARGFEKELKEDPDNRLLLFLAVNMLVKNSQSEQAMQYVLRLDQQNNGLPVYYIDYLRGEIQLQKGEYTQAIQSYQRFVTHHKSLSFKKDSYFKIALAYHLQGKDSQAKINFEKAKSVGRERADPDKYAAAQLKENKLPNAKLMKVRLATDGGYYKEAKETLAQITPGDLTSWKDQTEYYYRKARLAHKTNELAAARLFYQQTIDMTGSYSWYFAPNSALQLGYMAQANHDYAQARMYFQKALAYKKHEYKNSIDGKARSALDQIPKPQSGS